MPSAMKRKRIAYPQNIALILMLIILAVVLGCSSGQTQKNGLNNPSADDKEENKLLKGNILLKGVSLTPKSNSADDFNEFFIKAEQAGSMISWAGDWNELADKEKDSAPFVLSSLSTSYKFTPLVEAQFFTQSSGKLLRTLDDNTKEVYKKSAVEFAGKYKPNYFAMGIEINMLFESSPSDFKEFAVFYNETYSAIKEVSPTTKVFTIFQLERMKGLKGGLFGDADNKNAPNFPNETYWFLLDQFRSDIAAFTSYPSLIFKNPSEIPSDYYSEISKHTSKPIAFTEIGWHSGSIGLEQTGWESSQEEQAQFAARFFELADGLDTEFVIWPFMYDKDANNAGVNVLFNSMGLHDKEGKEKKAWNVWTGDK